MTRIKHLQAPFARYAVDVLGRVWSFARREPRELSPHLVPGGYLRVNLYTGGARERRLVHVLVAELFVPVPDELADQAADLVVRHLDDDPRHNHVSNLAWGTVADNVRDRRRNGGYDFIDPDTVDTIVDLRREGHTWAYIGREAGVDWRTAKRYGGRVLETETGAA